jgi:hypothetical protein
VESWSFGSMFLCMEDQSETAVVEDIQPHETVGSGFRLAGLLLHDFTITSDETPIISVDGYPPSFASGTRSQSTTSSMRPALWSPRAG